MSNSEKKDSVRELIKTLASLAGPVAGVSATIIDNLIKDLNDTQQGMEEGGYYSPRYISACLEDIPDRKRHENDVEKIYGLIKNYRVQKESIIEHLIRSGMNYEAVSETIIGNNYQNEEEREKIKSSLQVVLFKMALDLIERPVVQLRLVYDLRANQVSRLKISEINTQFNNLYVRVNNLEEDNYRCVDPGWVRNHYEKVIKLFKELPRNDKERITGDWNFSEAYIEPHVVVKSENGIHRLRLIEHVETIVREHSSDSKKYSDSDSYGCGYGYVSIICGDPGQGKTSFCIKTIYDFYKKEIFKDIDVKNVIWLSFSRQWYSKDIKNTIKEGEAELADIRDKLEKWIESDSYENSVVFIDGFDEYLALHSSYKSKDLINFTQKLDQHIREKGTNTHVFILTRTVTITNEIRSSTYVLKIDRLSESDRNRWFEIMGKHPEVMSYRECCYTPQRNDYKKSEKPALCDNPMLFRIMVKNRIPNNESIGKLHKSLFDKECSIKEISCTDKENVEKTHRNLAFSIYKDAGNDDLLTISTDLVNEVELCRMKHYLVFNEQQNGRRNKKTVEFWHRSFFDFFLSGYIFDKIINMSSEDLSEDVKEFFGSFKYQKLKKPYSNCLEILTDFIKEDIRENSCYSFYLELANRILKDMACFISRNELELGKIQFDNTIPNIITLISIICRAVEETEKKEADTCVQPVTFEDVIDFKIISELLRFTDMSNSRIEYWSVNRYFDLRDAYFEGSVLKTVKIGHCNADGINLTDAVIENIFMDDSSGNRGQEGKGDVNVEKATGESIAGSNDIGFNRSCFISASIKGVYFKNSGHARFMRTDFRNATLDSIKCCENIEDVEENDDLVSFYSSTFENAVIKNADFKKTNFDNCDFTHAQFENCIMQCSCHFINATFLFSRMKEMEFVGVDLNGILFERINEDENFWQRIPDTSFSVKMNGCNLNNVSFVEAYLNNGLFVSGMDEHKTIKNSSFQNATLTGCRFEKIFFDDVDFSGATLDNTRFIDCRFENINLEKIVRSGSVIFNDIVVSESETIDWDNLLNGKKPLVQL